MNAARHKGRRQLNETVRIPAPRGGINSVDGAEMPPEDCIYCYNMIAGEHGLRSRLGYREYLTGLTGAADNGIRSMLGFTGSAKNGAGDRLFAVTSSGIYDVTAGGVADGINIGKKVVAFAFQQNEAGYGSSTIYTIPGGRLLVYCDEENGAFFYLESTDTWTQAVLTTKQSWTTLTSYVVGNKVVANGFIWQCTIAGVSGPTPPSGAGPFVDGTVTWTNIGAKLADGVGQLGPSLADQNLGYTGDPTNFVHVTVWKNRLWFVEKNTTRAWYLDISTGGGLVTSFDFGPKLRTGGPLVALLNWSYDAGLGMDTSLVGISGGGDVVIYVGSDPASINTFALRGVWTVGAVPYGRRIATEHGGDILVMSLIGVLPLSKLVISGDTESKSLYDTKKIANLFNGLASTKRTQLGWQLLLHPTDNTLLITFPSAENNGNTDQLAMSFATRGWARYRNLPILSACVWNGDLHFGTADGRVCRNTDYVDAVLLSDPNSFTPVEYSVLTSYQNLDNPNEKKVELIRPIILSNTVNPVMQATAKYDYDLIEPDSPTGSSIGGWDSDTWDDAVWAGDYSASLALQGGSGCGRDVAIAIRGKAVSRTVLAGIDVMFQRGGLL